MIESNRAVNTSPPTFVHTATSLRDGLVELMNPQSRPEPSAAAHSDSIHGSDAIQLIKVPDVKMRHQVRAIRTKAFAYLSTDETIEERDESIRVHETSKCQENKRKSPLGVMKMRQTYGFVDNQ